jgi:hypothetical protein
MGALGELIRTASCLQMLAPPVFKKLELLELGNIFSF